MTSDKSTSGHNESDLDEAEIRDHLKKARVELINAQQIIVPSLAPVGPCERWDEINKIVAEIERLLGIK